MVDGLEDVAEAALDVADVIGDVVDAGSRRKRWKGCLILLAILAAIALTIWLLSD